MSDKTEINPMFNATVVNSEMGQVTAVNPGIDAASHELSAGAVIAGKYELIKPLSVSTGEADLYICEYDDMEYVAKIYRRQRAVKTEVLAALKSIDSPYVASLCDMGEYNGRSFVILPYYKNGSLQGRKFSLKELKKTIIPCINEALRVLHQNDIIHKDLKPSNIMLQDDNKGIAIIDFSISSVVEEGSTVLVTETGMTPEYSAPETFRNLFLEESDYYSFGITAYELFCGYTPYKNMSAEEIARYTAVQRIPFPKDMPQELQDFISAVTYFDITNRNKRDNPNRRWTYTEVSNWCRGKKQVIPGEGSEAANDNAIPAYAFSGRRYKDIPSLITALAGNWSEGKKQLYRGLLSAFFKNFNPEIAGYCMDAEEEAARSAGREDVIFWNLRNKLLSGYLKITCSDNEALAAAVSAHETAHAVGKKRNRNTVMNYYTMAYLLSGQKVFNIGSRKLKSVEELASYMKELIDSSYEEFEGFCHKMISNSSMLDVQLEAWLAALGKREELEAWRRQLAQ